VKLPQFPVVHIVPPYLDLQDGIRSVYTHAAVGVLQSAERKARKSVVRLTIGLIKLLVISFTATSLGVHDRLAALELMKAIDKLFCKF
jgi:hypothetical protein